jgi:excisionase family DNA binding protein
MEQPHLKSKQEAARYLNCSTGSVERLMRDPEDPLPALKIGNLVRFEPSALADWLERRRVK